MYISIGHFIIRGNCLLGTGKINLDLPHVLRGRNRKKYQLS